MARILVGCTLALLFLDVSASNGATFVYVSVAGEKTIRVYRVERESGKLTESGITVLEGEPGALAFSPDRTILFASIRSAGRLASFSVDQKTGKLKLLGTVPAGADPAFVATDRSGRFLLAAYYRAGKATVHRIGQDGSLGNDPIQTMKLEEKAHAILTDRANRFAYVPHTGPNAIYQLGFDSKAGKLSKFEGSRLSTPDNTGPRHLAFHPKLDVVYFDNEQGSSVSAFRQVPKRGRLTPMQTLSTLPKSFQGRNSCARLAISPSGKYLYAANRGHDSIAGFAVDAKTGKLTPVGQFATEPTPRGFGIDPKEEFVYVAGQKSGKLAGYRIDAKTGRLKRVMTMEVGSRPWWVSVVVLGE